MNTTFDTSGHVENPGWLRPVPRGPRVFYWHDLNPFTQGYVEALFGPHPRSATDTPIAEILNVGFSDLAPETLARIMEDCAAFSALPCATGGKFSGASFWAVRQSPWHAKGAREGNVYWDAIADFPPLTPYLADNGNVCLREALKAGSAEQ